MGIFHDIMSRVWKLNDPGMWQHRVQQVETFRSKAPVSHAPEQDRRQVSERRELLLDILQCGVATMPRGMWNISDKFVNGLSVPPAVVGMQQPRADGGSHPVLLFDRHMDRRAGKEIEPLYRRSAQQRRPADANPPGKKGGREGAGVEQCQTGKSITQGERGAESNRASPVVGHQREIIQIELLHESNEIIGVLSEAVGILLRFVTQSTADMIDRQNTITVTKSEDEIAPIKGPCWIAVNHQERLSLPLIHIVHAVATDVLPMGSEGKE